MKKINKLTKTFKKNNVLGRPKKYTDPKQLEKAIISYFNSLYEERKEDNGKTYQEQVNTPTISGLSLALGFANKSTLYDYRKDKIFSNLINRALSIIEQHHEESLTGRNPLGHTFVLKNMGGWHDKTETDITTKGKEVSNSNVLQIKFID